jgi:hypothetical protein
MYNQTLNPKPMSLKSLQAKCGVTADGLFGPGTMKAGMAYYKLTPEQAAHFFAQTAHESGNFKAFSENLNYGAKGLLGIFKKYFPDQTLAEQYEMVGSIEDVAHFSSQEKITTKPFLIISESRRSWTILTWLLPSTHLKVLSFSLTRISFGIFARPLMKLLSLQ